MDPRLLDKTWRLRHLYTIKDKDQKTVRFTPNKAQEHFNLNKHNRNIILKSRQLGFSTFESIDMLDDALFSRNFTGLIILHEQKLAIDIFKNKIYYAWDNFPDELKKLYTIDAERANQLVFDFGDKTFSTISTGATGRSGTYNRLHISELAKMVRKYPDKANEVMDGAIPSVPMSGRVDIESTAEGNYGMFYDMFWEAWNRNRDPHPTEYKAHFYNWTWDEAEISKIRTIIPIKEMDQWMRFQDIQKKYNFTDQQITYYYLTWISQKKSWNNLQQNYPITPEEAFVGSGHRLFSADRIAEMKLHSTNGTVDGDWIWYDDYVDTLSYALGVDVAEGVGQDSSTIVILAFTGSGARVVAEYCSNKIPPDQLAYEVRRGGNRYGQCIAAIERNNHGHTTLATLKGIYPNIYTEIKDENIVDKMTEKLGWLTTGASKPRMIYDLSQGINDGLIEIPSKYILEELNTYDKEDVSITRFNPDQSKHWDRVMALGIAWQMKAHAYETEMEINTYNKEIF